MKMRLIALVSVIMLLLCSCGAEKQVVKLDKKQTTTTTTAITEIGRVTLNSEEQLKAETARCLGCGATVVDQNRCIGCGVCTTRCKFDAIHLFRLPNGDQFSNMIPAEKKFIGIVWGLVAILLATLIPLGII